MCIVGSTVTDGARSCKGFQKISTPDKTNSHGSEHCCKYVGHSSHGQGNVVRDRQASTTMSYHTNYNLHCREKLLIPPSIYQLQLALQREACQPSVAIPVTTCTAGRSFSALCHTKTYPRSTMTEECLNNILLLAAHKEEADALDLTVSARLFTPTNTRRTNFFGTSCVIDTIIIL